MMRDCHKAIEVWRRIVPPSYHAIFLSENSVKKWMEMNLLSVVTVEGCKWSSWFSIICYQLWLARNNRVFQKSETSTVAIISKTKAWLSWGENDLLEKVSSNSSGLSWKPPDMGVIKINTDGAHSSSLNVSGCGGIMRDYKGNVN